MSRLQELLEELCPDGVEYKKLEQIADIGTGSHNTNEGSAEGEYPFYVRSQEPLRLDTYDYDEIAIITAGDGVGVGKVFHYVEGKYALHQRAYRIHINTDSVDTKFFFHYMKATFLDYIEKNMFKGSVASIRRPMFNAYKVPVPPLEVQREIVRVLDSFTLLLDELTDELTARKQQYEYYRNQMFTFDETVRVEKLGEVAKISRGIRVTKSQLIENGIFPVFQNALAPMGYYDKSNVDAETTYVISAGAAGEIGFCNEPFWAADDCWVFKELKGINNKYIYHFLMSKQELIKSRVRKASIPRLSRDVIENLIIPLPDIDVQNRIVDRLDNFEKLTNDIINGIPAEIEARHKQYEYYRDKILSFKELEA